MAKQFDALTEAHRAFIAQQKIFFAASAAPGTRVNISPREGAALRIVDGKTAIYLDRTGSGMETAAHLRADGRLTLMLCAVEGPPLILRMYGRGTSLFVGTDAFDAMITAHYGEAPLGTRQIVRLDIDLVQTSCGYGVPLFEYAGERPSLENWHENKGEEGLRAYWAEKNGRSIDGLDTGFPAA
ncbi:pyridoxamine 5'-phosphate oxidase family protein [Oceaniglobus roseus]|uniref:pyridoxamine 5'-phosphate oxidase family protein n=1 Tax=Oceaniglobus roseus TaxID=1737570 RepID=UPI000C7EEFBA|nr:pyridoxamine 5'-phosphate oxidase family protein [Kandeliimicrobium roseum]